jgi:hypothetical protein
MNQSVENGSWPLLGGDLPGDFLVQAQQALVGQVGLGLQHLQAGAELDQRDGAFDLLGFGQDALAAHGVPRWSLIWLDVSWRFGFEAGQAAS